MKLRTLAYFAFLLHLAVAKDAVAEEMAAADALFRAGREAFQRGDYVTAQERFSESFARDPAPGTLLNLALSEEQLGNVLAAWEHAKFVIEKLPASDDRHDIARQLYVRMDARTPRLRFVSTTETQEDATVLVDERVIPRNHWVVDTRVGPGKHDLSVRAKGRRERRFTIVVQESARLVIPLVAGDVESIPLPQQGAFESKTESTWVKVGWITAGAGVLSLGVCVTTGALALDRKNTVDRACDATGCTDEGARASSQGKTFSGIATLTGILTGVFGLASGGFFLTARALLPKRTGRPGPSVRAGVGTLEAHWQF